MTPKELADEQSKVIFENDDVMFIEIYGYQAMEYYGSEYLNRTYKPNKLRGGDLYLVIDKKGDKNYQIFEPKRGNVEIEDFEGRMKEFFEVIKKYPELEKILVDLVTINTPYGMLLQIKNGKEFDRRQLRDVDDCFGKMVFNSKTPGKSMIELHFDNSEFFGFFESSFTEGNWDLNILKGLYGGYGSYGLEIFDSDWVYYEWKEGYILKSIDDENSKLLDRIIILASPGLHHLKKTDDEKYWIEVSKFLSDNFSSESDKISYEYQEQLNDNADKRIKEYAVSDIGDPFRNNGVFVKGNQYFNTYVTTVNILLSLYSLVGDKTLSISELFGKLAKSLSLNIGNYNEIGRESWDYDSEQFNEVVKDSLEKILDSIEENPEKYEGTKKYGEVLQAIDKMGYEIGRYYPLPYDKKKQFKIDGVNKENLRIILTYTSGNDFEKRTYSLEEFNNFLQSPELFESLVRKLKKLL
jgi:hypothetical protein